MATCLFAGGACAQSILVSGTVKNSDQGVPVEGARLALWWNHLPVDTLYTDSTGSYEVELGSGAVLRIRFGADSLVGKTLLIDGTGIPRPGNEGGFGMNVHIDLFMPRPGVDYAFLLEPMGIARYDTLRAIMAWDEERTQTMKEILKLGHG